MDQLFHYILAIKSPINATDQHSCQLINTHSEDASYHDDGVYMDVVEDRFYFSNGVVIKKVTEVEQGCQDSDMRCAECWISYDVISAPETLNIWPQSKSFINQCQEAFWLKISEAKAIQ